MADDSHLADLERRVARDPASIAFAQLAEEYRRLGRFDDAVRVSRDGLTRYPDYPSARVTLARALLALGRAEEAAAEFDEAAALDLQTWLDAIAADRAARRSGPAPEAPDAAP